MNALASPCRRQKTVIQIFGRPATWVDRFGRRKYTNLSPRLIRALRMAINITNEELQISLGL